MAKLGCQCGHTIVDQTDDIAYKAVFVRDQDQDLTWEWTSEVGEFIAAIKNSQRDAWVTNFYSGLIDIDDASVVFDIVLKHSIHDGIMYQCEACGRIKIQVGKSNKYASFNPEDDLYVNILNGVS